MTTGAEIYDLDQSSRADLLLYDMLVPTAVRTIQ
jgi:hypothetical protein